MKFGIFDSGLGGLIVTKGIINHLPDYDTIYLGDTARVAYGDRSQAMIYEFSIQAMDFLFRHDCQLIIVACNTASAEALRKIQQDYLPIHYPNRRVLGVLIPAAETAINVSPIKLIGIIATRATVASNAFEREIRKLDPSTKVFQNAAPLLVPLIENNDVDHIETVLLDYLKPLLNQSIDTLILGSTHYSLIKDVVAKIVGPDITIVSADETVPAKLEDYLSRHPEIERQLSRSGDHQFCVTDISQTTRQLAHTIMGRSITINQVTIT